MTANDAQAERWRTSATEWIRGQEAYDRMLAGFGDLVLERAAIAAGDDVVDIGCGTGALTRAAAVGAAPGAVTGVDISPPMVEHARALAARAGIENVSFVVADAQIEPLPPSRVAVSRFGVMFFADPAVAFANVHAALGDTGRLVFVCWARFEENPWMAEPIGAIRAALADPSPPGDPTAPGPFALGDAHRLRALLEAAGFGSVDVRTVDGPVVLGGGGLDDAVAFTTSRAASVALLEGRTDDERNRAVAAVRAVLAAHDGPDGVSCPGRVHVVVARH